MNEIIKLPNIEAVQDFVKNAEETAEKIYNIVTIDEA